jgi:hypothetical protein
MRTKTLLTVAAVLLVLSGALAVLLTRAPADEETASPALQSFDSVKSGVALMEALDCDGKPVVVSDGVNEHRVRGTGFLVGPRLLMGVEHMVPSTPGVVCGFRARLGGRWYDVQEVRVWSERGESDRRGIDVATATLASDAPGHLFRFASESVPVGTTLTLLSHPLGGPLREARAVVTKKPSDYGKPTIAARVTPDVQGGESGGPLLNERGEVVSVLARIVTTANLTPDGRHHHGGIDIPTWWGEAVKSDLCRAHPEGGIPDCDTVAGSEPVKTPVRVKLQ